MVLSPVAELRQEAIMKKMEERLQHAKLQWFEKNYEAIFADTFRPSHLTPKSAGELHQRIVELRKEEFEAVKVQKELDAQREKDWRQKMVEYDSDKSRQQRFQEEGTVMKPIPPEIRQILYNGISQTGEGRFLYLKTRNKLGPHERFYRKLTTGHVYGWKIEERAGRPIKQFNRLAVIKGSFYRRFGAVRPESDEKRQPYSSGLTSPDLL